MELTLHTEFAFASAHQLKEYNGRCENLHGHTWFVELWFKGDSAFKDKVGILVDFGIVKELDDLLDHKYINDIIDMNPTAENLAEWIYNWCKTKINNERILVKTRVYEDIVSKKAYCECGDFK